jgi:beta-adrenergic-receptor kinase
MEELQDAIEDAQYLSAVSSVEDGPRPVLPWEIPTEEQLAAWKKSVQSRTLVAPLPFQFEWVLSKPLGMFLFSSYLKEVAGEYVEINFIEEVTRWKATRGRIRADITSRIVGNYLTPVPLSSMAEEEANVGGDDNEGGAHGAKENGGVNKPQKPPKTEINEYDLAMQPLKFTPDKVKELHAEGYDASTDKSAVGICGPVLDRINKKVDQLRNSPGFGMKFSRDSVGSTNRESVTSNDSYDLNELIHASFKIEKDKSKEKSEDEKKKETENSTTRRHLSLMSNALPEDLFDEVIAILAENIKQKHWEDFLKSEQYTKLLNFLWFQDRPVVEEDFFLMRVLGRGGFGLVTGEFD